MKVSAILKNYWLPLLALNGTAIVCAAMIAAFAPRTWTASAQLILPDTTTNLDASLGTLGQLKDQGVTFSNELNPLQVQTSILTSDDTIREVWLSDAEKEKFSSLETYKKLFKVKPVDQSTSIQVSVTAQQPELAKQRAAMLLKSYEQRLNQLRQGTADARQKFTQSQVAEAERNLLLAKNQLGQFKQSTGLASSEEQTRNLVEGIKTLKTTYAQTLAESKAAVTRTQALSLQLRMTPQQAMASLRLSQNKEYQALRQKLTEVDTELAVNRGIYTDASPTIQSLLDKRQQIVTALNNQRAVVVPNATQGLDTSFGGNNVRDTTMELIAQLIQAENEGKAKQKQAMQIQQQIQSLEQELSRISAQQANLLDLQRKYDIAEGVYKGIVAQLEQAKISAFNAYPNIQVLDRPTVDPKPTSPKRSLIALGSLLTSVFGSLALLSFLESRNSLLKQKDLQNIELPVITRIPAFKSTVGLSLTSETELAFQRFASTISLMPLENRRLMIASAMSREGKTTLTAGLASALVVLGFRVLIVDADYHKSELTQHFSDSLPNDPNLSIPVQISPGLDLLSATPMPNNKVMEFVGRGAFERHLDAIQKAGQYDYVIVDTPPVVSTSEAVLMAKAVANVLLVVRLGVSDRYVMQETLEQLMCHNAQIIGLALNGIEQRIEGYNFKHGTQVQP